MMNWLDRRHSYGVALATTGLPVVWILRELAGASSLGATGPSAETQIYSIFFMVISLGLIVHLPNLIQSVVETTLPLISRSISRLLPLAYLVPCILASTAIGPSIFSIDTFYLLFIIAFMIALNSVPRDRLQYLPEAFLIIGGVGSIVLLFYTFSSGIQLDGNRLGAGSTNSPNQVAGMGGTAIIAALFLMSGSLRRLNSFLRLYIYAVIIIGLVLIIFTTSRAIIMSLIFCLLYSWTLQFNKCPSIKPGVTDHLIRPRRIRKKKFLKFFEIEIVIAIAIVTVLLFYADHFKDTETLVIQYYEQFSTYLQRGFESYVNNTGEEQSASIRRGLIEQAMKNMTDQGNGYKALWLDFPLLQAYYDGGLLGGTVFLLISAIIPFLYVVKGVLTTRKDALNNFCSYLYLFTLPGLFFHGQPYDYTLWLKLVLIYSILGQTNLSAKPDLTQSSHPIFLDKRV